MNSFIATWLQMRFVAAILLVTCLSSAASASPNFVVILTDDQDDTGSMTYMPKTLSLVAEHGVTFINSFVNLPLCAPSRASFLTGQAAHNHGIIDNDGGKKFGNYEKDALPVWLQEAGYKTALIGKYINGYRIRKQPKSWSKYWSDFINELVGPSDEANAQTSTTVPPGWSFWYASPSGSYYHVRINENGKVLKFGDGPSDYSTDVLRNRAIRFIKDQAGSTEPFFMLIATHAPHGQGEGDGVKGPAIPAPAHQHEFTEVELPRHPAHNKPDVSNEPLQKIRGPEWERGDVKAYRAALQSLQSVDELVAGVVDALRDARKLDNTVIIYTSDNGFIYDDPGREGKNSAYEGSIRVPLLMRGPGIPEDATRGQLVNNLDLVATIVELAGAKPDLSLDGRSLVPLFAERDVAWRGALLIDGGTFEAVRTDSKAYIRSANGFEELYDLYADPYELENKARDPSYANDLTMLRADYDRLAPCVAASCWMP